MIKIIYLSIKYIKIIHILKTYYHLSIFRVSRFLWSFLA